MAIESIEKKIDRDPLAVFNLLFSFWPVTTSIIPRMK
jgi:hypothetical protein